MRVLNVLLLSACAAAAVNAAAIDDEITKLEATLVELKAIKAAESTNSDALKFVTAAAMASSSSTSGSSDSTVTAGDTSENSEYDIEPQPTRAATEAPSAASSASASSTTASSTASSEATTSASASASASTSSASTIVPSAFALVAAAIYAML